MQLIDVFEGDLPRLQEDFHSECLDFVISRSEFIAYSALQESLIHEIGDSQRQEEATDLLLLQKMRFTSALDHREVCLGDSLLHVAARRGHHAIAWHLLERGCDVTLENTMGESPSSCCTLHPSLRLFLGDMQMAVEALDPPVGGLSDLLFLVHSLHLVWPEWMFDEWESEWIVSALLPGRVGRPGHAKMLAFATSLSSRCKRRLSREGIALARDLLVQAQGNQTDAKKAFTLAGEEVRATHMHRVCINIYLIIISLLSNG
jgi:hypothetical protein